METPAWGQELGLPPACLPDPQVPRSSTSQPVPPTVFLILHNLVVMVLECLGTGVISVVSFPLLSLKVIPDLEIQCECHCHFFLFTCQGSLCWHPQPFLRLLLKSSADMPIVTLLFSLARRCLRPCCSGLASPCSWRRRRTLQLNVNRTVEGRSESQAAVVTNSKVLSSERQTRKGYSRKDGMEFAKGRNPHGFCD